MAQWYRQGWNWLGARLDGLRSLAARRVAATRRQVRLASMREGDIVLASPRLRRLSPIALLYRLLLGSQYVHSMLYLGGGRMIHTTARHGVVEGPVPRKLFDGQRYAVYRCPGLDDEQRRAIVAHARASLARRLDHVALVANIPSRWLRLRRPLWRLERDRVWCSQLIAEAYREGAGVELVDKVRAGTIVTEDLAGSDVLERV